MTLNNGKAADLSKAPHLAAILARTAAKTRKALPARFRPSTPLSSGTTASYEYRPSSTQSLLERLATYKLNTYANKPPAIDALAAAKCGWVNDGKDRLVCGICRASWVLAGREGMNRDAGTPRNNDLRVKSEFGLISRRLFVANALVEKQRIQLVDMHKDGCPWKKRQCDGRFRATPVWPCESSDVALADVYRISLASPAVMAKEIKSRARSLESVLEGVGIKHPLVQVTPPCRVPYLIAFVLVLDASQEPFGDHFFRRSRTSYQKPSRVRERGRRRTTYHKIVTTPRAVVHCHSHVDVRLVSCPPCAPLPPTHDCFSFVVPRLFCCPTRNSQCQCAIVYPSDTETAVGNG